MRASASSVRSTTSSSPPPPRPPRPPPGPRPPPARARRPAARPAASSRTGGPGTGAQRAPPGSLLGAAPGELLAHRLGAAPHLDHLNAPGPHLAQHQLALDALGVEQGERAVHRLGSRRVAEAVRGADSPVPLVLRVRHGV